MSVCAVRGEEAVKPGPSGGHMLNRNLGGAKPGQCFDDGTDLGLFDGRADIDNFGVHNVLPGIGEMVRTQYENLYRRGAGRRLGTDGSQAGKDGERSNA